MIVAKKAEQDESGCVEGRAYRSTVVWFSLSYLFSLTHSLIHSDLNVCRFPRPKLTIEQGLKLQSCGGDDRGDSAPAEFDSGDDRDHPKDLCADGPAEDISVKVWLRLPWLTLWESDRRVFLRPNDWLNDNHLFGGMRQIEAAVPGSGQSQPPSMSAAHASARNTYRFSEKMCSTAIHGGTINHWTVSAEMTGQNSQGSTAPVYIDAFMPLIPDTVRRTLLLLYKLPDANSVRIRRLNPYKQEDCFSCGHRVLGWAYLIAHGGSIEHVASTYFDVVQIHAWVKRLLEVGGEAGPPPVTTVPEDASRINSFCDDAWWWVTVYPDKVVEDPR